MYRGDFGGGTGGVGEKGLDFWSQDDLLYMGKFELIEDPNFSST